MSDRLCKRRDRDVSKDDLLPYLRCVIIREELSDAAVVGDVEEADCIGGVSVKSR